MQRVGYYALITKKTRKKNCRYKNKWQAIKIVSIIIQKQEAL
jgi:hypothetical protein